MECRLNSPDNIADHSLADIQCCCLDSNYYYFDRIEAIGSSIDHRHLPDGFVVGKDRRHRYQTPTLDAASMFPAESIDVSADCQHAAVDDSPFRLRFLPARASVVYRMDRVDSVATSAEDKREKKSQTLFEEGK